MSRRRKKRSRTENAKQGYDGFASVFTTPCTAGPSGPASPLAVVGATAHGPMGARSLPTSVPVFAADLPHHALMDQDGHPVYVTESEARVLMLKGRATFIRKTKHLRGIRVIPEILSTPQRAGSIREGSVIDPTDSAGIDNVRGNWAWNAPIYRRRNGNAVREPATTRTFRSLPRCVEQVLLEERRRFFEKLAA